MAKYHGKRAAIYMSSSGATAATRLDPMTDWSLDLTQDTVEVTAFGDSTKTYVQGYGDCKGTFTGWYDDALTAALFTSNSSATPVKMYLYIDVTNAPTKYAYGTAFLTGATITAGTGAAVRVTSGFVAATGWSTANL